MPEAHLRAADADRAALATVLGEHMAAGRLTVGEYEERLGRAYTARTYGELAELTTDLPAARATRRISRKGTSKASVRARGFTLVELMVVIVIIGLLATVVAINVLPSQDRAMSEKAKADIAVLEQALATAIERGRVTEQPNGLLTV